MSTDLIVIDPPVINLPQNPIVWDADALERHVNEAIEPYLGTVVTEDTVSGARDVCAMLNKSASALDTARKAVKRDWLIPLAEFEASINGISAKIMKARSGIANQVSAFDESRRTELLGKLREALKIELASQVERFKIGKRFSQIDIEPLVKLINGTSSGNLTKQAIIDLELIVGKAKVAQERYIERMAKLDEINNRFGLELTEKSVGSLLQADAETWIRELKRIVDVAIAAQAAARKQPEPKLEPQDEAVLETTQPDSASTKSRDVPDAGKDGRVEVRVVVEIYVRIKPSTTHQKVRDAVSTAMKEAGFTDIRNVKIGDDE